jgi:hypothetical protein
MALELILWGCSFLLVAFVGWSLTLSPFITIILFFVVCGGLFTIVRGLLAGLYVLICRIAISKKFRVVWTIIWVIVYIVINCINFWPILASFGVLGVIGGLIITGFLVTVGIAICGGSVDGEEWLK